MEKLADDLATMVRTPLEDAHVDVLRREGREWRAEPGQMLQELGKDRE